MESSRVIWRQLSVSRPKGFSSTKRSTTRGMAAAAGLGGAARPSPDAAAVAVAVAEAEAEAEARAAAAAAASFLDLMLRRQPQMLA